MFSEAGYPFHAVRYFLQPGEPLWDMMASTSYSSSDPIRVGGGVEKLGPCVSVCLNRERRPAWKTSWIFHVGGSLRRYTSGDRT